MDEATASKLARVREQMEKEEAQYHIISTLDDIAWILNVRGNDIPHVPDCAFFPCNRKRRCNVVC